MGNTIGIDLGTDYTRAAVYREGRIILMEGSDGTNRIPTYYGLSKEGQPLIGGAAKKQAVLNPTRTIYAINRLIGMKYDDIYIQKIRKYLPFELIKSDNGDLRIKIDNSQYSPEHLIGLIIQSILKSAGANFGGEFDRTVISVPTSFYMHQRRAIWEAAKIAGFSAERLIESTSAIALAYQFMNKIKDDRMIVVCDFGGSHFGISAIAIGEGITEVVFQHGSHSLGGIDLDWVLMDYILSEFRIESGIDLAEDTTATQRIKDAAEIAKIELSSKNETEIMLPNIVANKMGAKHLSLTISRKMLESLVYQKIRKILEFCRLSLTHVEISEIDEVIIVGGMTRMPLIKSILREFFNKSSFKALPVEYVAIGTAVTGAILSGDIKDLLLLPASSHSLGIETSSGNFEKLIPRNCTIPTKKLEVFPGSQFIKQGSVIRVFEGEQEEADKNILLAELNISEILETESKSDNIEICFDVDLNGILHVSVQNIRTRNIKTATVTGMMGITETNFDS